MDGDAKKKKKKKKKKNMPGGRRPENKIAIKTVLIIITSPTTTGKDDLNTMRFLVQPDRELKKRIGEDMKWHQCTVRA